MFARGGSSVSIIGIWIRNLGIWRNPNGRGIHWLAAISIACFIFICISVVISLIRAENNREKFESAGLLPFCGMGLLKLLSLISRHQQWRTLISNTREIELQLIVDDSRNVDYESDNEDTSMNTYRKHVAKYTKQFHSTSSFLFRIYIFTVVVFTMSPFIEYFLRKCKGADVLNYPHILPGWTALDEKSFLGYIASVVTEGVGAVYCVYVHTVFDVSVAGIMIFIHGQFLLLYEYSENIAGKGRMCTILTQRDLRAHYRIAKCHRLHVSLIKLVQQLRSLTQNMLGIYFAVSALTFCSVAVQVKSNELSTTQMFSLIQYMCGTLIQLFLFCNYGDAVINESSIGFGEGPFGAAWWCLGPQIRRELALLCVGMTRRCRLLAGPFHSLDLPAFIQIVRTAYSYYAVIRTK